MRLLLLLATLAAAAVVALLSRTEWIEEALRRRLVGELARAGYALEIRDLQLHWLPLEVEVRGVEVRPASDPRGPAFLSIRQVTAVPSLRRSLGGLPAFRYLSLEGPTLHLPDLRRPGTSSSTAPAAAGPGGEGLPLRLIVDRLAVQDGQVQIGDETHPISCVVGGLQVDAALRGPGRRLPWRLVVRSLRLEGRPDWAWEGRAEARGSVAGGLLEVERMRVRGGSLELDGRGSSELSRLPAWRFSGEASLSAALSARWIRGLPDLSGRIRLEGTAQGQGLDLRAEVDLSAPDLRIAAFQVKALAGRVTLQPQRVTVDSLQASLLGGEVQLSYLGERNDDGSWSHSTQLSPRQIELATALRLLELGDYPWNARLSGELEASWSRADVHSLVGSGSVVLHPGPVGTGERFPLAGEAKLSLAGRSLLVRSASLRGAGVAVDLQGRIGIGSGSVAFRGQVDRPEQVRIGYLVPIVAHLSPQAALPPLADLQGRLQFEGNAELTPTGWEAIALLEGTDMAWQDAPLGQVSGLLSLDAERLRVREALAVGPGHRFEGELDFWLSGPTRGRLETTARFQTDGIDTWAEVVAGRGVPVEGAGRGDLRIARHGCGLEGLIQLEMPEAMLFGTVPANLEARLQLERGRVELRDVRVSLAGGDLRASGEVRLGEAATLDLSISASGMKPHRLLPGPVARYLGGTLSAEGTLRGAATDPKIHGHITYLAPDGAPIDLGDAGVQIDGRLGGLRVRLEAPTHGIVAFGQVEAADDFPVRLEVMGDAIDLALLQASFGWEGGVPLRGEVELNGTIFGPLRTPSQVRAEARITRLRAELPSYALRNEGPISVGWSDGVATLRPARLIGVGTDITLRGRMVPGGPTDASLRGTLNLQAVEGVVGGLELEGSAEMDLSLVTQGDAAVYSGGGELTGGSLAFRGLPGAVTEISAGVEFRGPSLVLTHLEGHYGRGEIGGSGSVRFAGLRPAGVDLEIVGRDVRLRFPRELESVGDFRLVLSDQPDGFALSGSATIVRGIYRVPSTTQSSLLPARSRASIGIGGAVDRGGGLGERLTLDIDIAAPHSLYVRGDDANIEASGDLHLGGTFSTPQLSGRIIAMEGGLIRFRDARYRVTNGFIDFAEYGDIDPLFHVEALTSVQDYDITLEMDGRLSDFTFELTSYPPLTHEEILILLIMGRTPDEHADKSGSVVGGEMAQALAAPLGSGFARAMGLTQVRIEPINLNGNARLTLIKDVNENLRVSFSDEFSTAGNQVYQIEYDITPQVEIIAARDEEGGVGGDLRYTTRAYSYKRRDVPQAPRRILGSLTLADPLPVPRSPLEKRLKLKEGRPFRRAQVVDAVDRLRDHLSGEGYFEARVQVEEEEVDGSVHLEFRVQGGPRYDIVLQGALKERKLRRRLNAVLQELPGDVESTARTEILDFHRERGFPQPQIDLQVESNSPTAVTLRFHVEPGEQAKVAAIDLGDVHAFSAVEIGRVMLTRPGDVLKRDVLDEDLRTIVRLYRENGYQEIRMNAPAILFEGEGTQATIRLSLNEGPPWRIGALRFEGNTVFADEELRALLGLEPGQPVTRTSLDAARTELRKRYDSNGYIDARVTYSVEGDDPAAREVIYRVEEGAHYVVGGIRVRGNEHTRDKVIWRDLEMDEGDDLSRERLLQTQRRLSRLGIFRSVDVQVEGEPQDEEQRVVVQVREAPNIRTSVGAGWDTEARAKGFIQVRNNNLWGRNQTLGGVASASSIYRRVRFSFLEPRLFGRRLEGLLTAAWSDEEKPSFDEQRLSAGLGMTRRLGPYRYLWGYVLEDVALDNLQLTADDDLMEERVEDLRLGSAGMTVIRNLRDDVFNPRRGLFYSLQMQLFLQQLASEQDFVSFFGRLSYHLPLTPRTTWAQGVRIGLAQPFRDSAVPISERFFAGGDSTLRGFGRDEVGPKDPVTGSPTGGDAMLILNEEYRFPIYGPLSGTVFVDVGNVYLDIGTFDARGLRWVAGAGVHFRTPIGPLRLEYGRKLDRREGESRGELFFSIGQAF